MNVLFKAARMPPLHATVKQPRYGQRAMFSYME